MKQKMVHCKNCGEEIAASEKKCSHCNTKQNRSILRKWWLWVIVAILLVAIIGSGKNANNEEKDVNGNTEQPDNLSTAQGTSEKETPISETKEPSQQETSEKETQKEMTMGQKNALEDAKSYLRFSAFSYEGLIEQLEFEKYSREDAVFAADNCGADWNEQALLNAKSYLSYSAFSYTGLIEQLEFEKYTTEQATYAADNCGADWNEQAAKSAKSYLDFSSFSKEGLIDQLEFEGFTREQAEYGVKANGYD